jgi:hypothetical protein
MFFICSLIFFSVTYHGAHISQGVVALGYKPVKSDNLDTRIEDPYLPVPQ